MFLSRNWYDILRLSYNKLQISKIDFYKIHSTKTMDISIIRDDETEDEIELALCCHVCSGWKEEIFNEIYNLAAANKPINVPNHIITADQFRTYFSTK
jgi:hypothetical protein